MLSEILSIFAIVFSTISSVLGFMNFFNKNSTREPAISKVLCGNSTVLPITFDQVIGLETVIQEIRDIIFFLENPGVIPNFNFSKSIFLYGPSGTGKSLIGKAFCSTKFEGINYFYINSSDINSIESTEKFKSELRKSVEKKPTVVFVANIERISNQQVQQILLNLLAEVCDELNDRLVIIATTSKPQLLSMEVIGKFDETIKIDLPNIDNREKILNLHSKNIRLDSDVDMRRIAEITENFSGSGLKILLAESAISAFKNHSAIVHQQDILEALNKFPVFGKTNSDVSENSQFSTIIPKLKFEDIGGYIEEKEHVLDTLDYYKQPEKYKQIGVNKPPRSFLFYGPAGTGKTSISEAISSNLSELNNNKCIIITICGSDFINKYVGEGAARMRELFDYARNLTELGYVVVIRIEEIDAILKKISDHDNNEQRQTLKEFLYQMDQNPSIILIGTTNITLNDFDPPALRRFIEQIEIKLPNLNDRKEIIQIYVKKVKISQNIDLEQIALKTQGFSGADIEKLFNSAAILAVKADHCMIEQEDIDEAFLIVILGFEHKSLALSNEEKRRTAIHELGHALIAIICKTKDIITISIKPRGDAQGYIWSVPKLFSYYSQNKEDFLSNIYELLGGLAFEELFYGSFSAGARSDLEKSTEITHYMIVHCGFSEYGIAQKINEKDPLIQKEVIKVMNEYKEKTTNMLRPYKSKVEGAINHLLKYGNISQEELMNFIGEQSALLSSAS
ncbi:MAG: ATP-dependent zinc metalloprotease FtsH [Candidatus Paraimprobicoccus trichonymphae]|uniref:ATP-dependent zinc metalloprotease FtsH n=1 Tax=Candidatus Paraimprobicoccus trichonymphae TaxID=3033793 RepID=A0AA48IAH8_9FIRM|nr:MAG: ATP-dependent zinc metalloprotease FtsH [Candidatus Paraimprobicoccus trichonymphae]